jgi:hypothetical protein
MHFFKTHLISDPQHDQYRTGNTQGKSKDIDEIVNLPFSDDPPLFFQAEQKHATKVGDFVRIITREMPIFV